MKPHHASQHFGHLFGSAVACYLALIPLFHLTTFGNASPAPPNRSAGNISNGQSLPLSEQSPSNGNGLPESNENQYIEDTVNISNIPSNNPVNDEGLGSAEQINSRLPVNKPKIVQTKQPSGEINITSTEKGNVTSLNDTRRLEVTSKSSLGEKNVTTATPVVDQSTSTTAKVTSVDPLHVTIKDLTSLPGNSTDVQAKIKNSTLHSEDHSVSSNPSPKPSPQQIVKVEPAEDDSKDTDFAKNNNSILPTPNLTQPGTIPVELPVSNETEKFTTPAPTEEEVLSKAIGVSNSKINAQSPSHDETKLDTTKPHTVNTSQSNTTASTEKVQLIPSTTKKENKPLDSINNPTIPKPSPVVPKDNMENLDVENETPMTSSIDTGNFDDPDFGNDDPKKTLNKADVDEDEETVDQPNANPADGFKKDTDEFDGKDFEKPRGNLGSLKPPDHVTEFPEQEDSHFFAYFVTAIIVFIIGYLVVHNKQKILGLIVEGRTGRRRRSHVYKRLENDGTKFNQIF